MFCPNCGTKNDGVELPCKKCGFKLSGAAVVPKFRGTMMLNTDQSVQELLDEHRRKQAEEGEAPEASEPGEGPGDARVAAGAPAGTLFGMPSTAKAAPAQPPRAGLPQRRMGTMMGVAPQVGGVQPPAADLLASGPEPAQPEADPANEDVPPAALAGTVAVPTSPPAGGPMAGRTEAFEAVPVARSVAPVPTEEKAPEGAWMESASDVPAAPSAAPRPTEPLNSVAPRARGTEPLESVAPPGWRTEPFESVAPPVRRQRVRPLDLFLILITCGLYGFVLLARQRGKRPDAS